MKSPLVFWHGSTREKHWDRHEAFVRPAKKGRTEHGPGIYMTTSFERARSYAKGGGVVFKFEIEPDLRWIDNVIVPVEAVRMLALTMPSGSKAKRIEISGQLGRVSERQEARIGRGNIYLSSFVNLLVNADALVGTNAPFIAAALVELGADAELVDPPRRLSPNEQWLVLYNPAKVRRAFVVRTSDVPVSEYDLPPIAR